MTNIVKSRQFRGKLLRGVVYTLERGSEVFVYTTIKYRTPLQYVWDNQEGLTADEIEAFKEAHRAWEVKQDVADYREDLHKAFEEPVDSNAPGWRTPNRV